MALRAVYVVYISSANSGN